jgi:lincosamide nucleotidyltransferase A/C/D/E
MYAEDVLDLYNLFERNGIITWIDGGWGVDALLGKQTRSHKDLDIAINHKDKQQLLRLLQERGYKDVPRDDTSDWNFVLGDDEREIAEAKYIPKEKDIKDVQAICQKFNLEIPDNYK